jgi:hypothetical protein
MTVSTNFNVLSLEIYAENAKWWINLDTGERLVRNKGELICLMHSELSEAFSGFDESDDHLPARRMFDVELADVIIRLHDYAGGFGYDLELPTVMDDPPSVDNRMNLLRVHEALSKLMEAERRGNREAAEYWLALTNRRIRNFAAYKGIELDTIVDEKRAYNRSRVDHSLAARRTAGGKKW